LDRPRILFVLLRCLYGFVNSDRSSDRHRDHLDNRHLSDAKIPEAAAVWILEPIRVVAGVPEPIEVESRIRVGGHRIDRQEPPNLWVIIALNNRTGTFRLRPCEALMRRGLAMANCADTVPGGPNKSLEALFRAYGWPSRRGLCQPGPVGPGPKSGGRSRPSLRRRACPAFRGHCARHRMQRQPPAQRKVDTSVQVRKTRP
jgi:hypothetical protein